MAKQKKTPYVLDLKKVFDDYMDNNQKVWAHDRQLTVGASEVFGCLREAWFKRLGEKFGYKEDEDFVQRWGATERGNIIENNFVEPAVAKYLPEGLGLLYAGDGQHTFVQGKASATPDGLIVGLPKGTALTVQYGEHIIEIDDIISDCINFEIKSIDPMANLSEEKKKHNYQTHMQMGMFHEKTEHRPHFTIILYINASWLDDITPFVVEYDPKIYSTGKGRAEDVYTVEDPNDIIPEGRMDGSCEYCSWKLACGTTIIDNMPEKNSEGDLHEEDVADFVKFIADYKEAQAMCEEFERKKKIAQERIKEILAENKVRKARMPDDGGSVSWSQVKGKITVDTKAAEADGVDLEPYKKTGNPYDRLNIRVKKAKTELKSKSKSK